MMPGWFRRLPLPTSLKHLAGSAWLMAGRLMAMGSIAGFGFAVFLGALSAIDSTLHSRDAWYEQGRLADLELRVVADDADNFPDFTTVAGVADARVRMMYPGSLSLPANAEGAKGSLRALVLATSAESKAPINTQQLIAGQALDPGDSDGVVIERSLARYHGVKVGDRLPLKLGKEQMSVRVRGIVTDAEFLLAPANPSLFVPSKGSLGVLYANPTLLSERFGFVLANSVLIRARPGVDIEAVRKSVVEHAQSRLNVEFTLTRSEQFSHQFLEKDLGVFQIMVPVIVLVSALSAIFVTAFLLMQWVARERQTLAVFLTLGHPPKRLVMSFAAILVYLASGVVLGGIVFAAFVGKGFQQNFAESIGLPLPEFSFTPMYLAWSLVGVVMVFGCAGLLAIRRIFALSPRDAMRDGATTVVHPDRVGTALASWLPSSWMRYPVRALFRNRWVSATSVIAIALGFGINAAFFISYSSFIGTSLNRVEQNRWDAAVDFVAPMWYESIDDLTKANGIEHYALYTKGVVQAVKDGRRVNLYVGGFDPDKDWHAVTMVAGQDLSTADPSGILIEQSTAEQLGIAVDDPIVLEVNGSRHRARVRGLFSGAMPGEARFTIAYHQQIADLDSRATGLFLRNVVDLSLLSKGLLRSPDVQQVLTKAEVANEILSASGQVATIIRLGAIISIAIAALFVFACVGYLVIQRNREYQMLRLLGYRDSFIVAIIVIEVALLGVAAMLLAIPIGALAAQYLNRKLSEAWFQVDTIIGHGDYLQTFLPGAALLPMVALPLAWMVLRNPLDQVLRSRAIS